MNNKPNRNMPKPDIPERVITKWQKTIDLLCEVISVPAGLIMKVHSEEIEVFVSSHSEGNPYEKGERARLNTGLYCETVMARRGQLLVPDARKDPQWDHNPDIELDMVSYLGLPLIWPDGQVFGTICVLDNKENPYSNAYQRLLAHCREMIEVDIEAILERAELGKREKEAEQLNRAMVNLMEDLQAANRRQERTGRELESANKELEAFSYSVSHDLRAPLRAIDGFGQVLIEDCGEQLDDEGKRLLRIIKENTKKMGQLIDDLLAFSRMSRKTMSSTEIDMNALTKSVCEELHAHTPERQLRFEIKKLPSAYGDRPMIHEVWMNLLSNAIKFTRPVDTPVIEVGGTSDKNENIYHVKDNGAGFDMKYIDKLFGVFQRLHIASDFEGTGVGLALVQRIIHRHRGRVWAEGQVNKGAAFYFTLPKNEGDLR